MDNYLKEALHDFKKRKILVVGDIILDRFRWGKVRRINPEQPAAPLVNIYSETYVLGGAANVANNIVSLRANATLYGILGNDRYAAEIQNHCDEKSILLRGFYNDKPSIVKERVMAHGQQMIRLDCGEDDGGGLEKITKEIQDNILQSLEKEIRNYDLIILSDYNKFLFNNRFSQSIIALANSNNLHTIVDPKPDNADFFKNCTIICPNKDEAEKITGIKYSNGEDILTRIGKSLSQKINAKYVIITCSEDGVFSYHDGNSLFIPTIAKEVADVTGAGDTFAAALGLGFASNLNIHNAAKLANYAAGVVVEKIGTATPTIEEIEAYLI